MSPTLEILEAAVKRYLALGDQATSPAYNAPSKLHFGCIVNSSLKQQHLLPPLKIGSLQKVVCFSKKGNDVTQYQSAPNHNFSTSSKYLTAY